MAGAAADARVPGRLTSLVYHWTGLVFAAAAGVAYALEQNALGHGATGGAAVSLAGQVIRANQNARVTGALAEMVKASRPYESALKDARKFLPRTQEDELLEKAMALPNATV